MGMRDGKVCAAKTHNVSVASMMSTLSQNSHGSSSNSSNPSVVDVDATWLMLNETQSSDSIRVKLEKTVAIVNVFSKHGFDCAPTCDLEYRHHTKRAPFGAEWRRSKSVKI